MPTPVRSDTSAALAKPELLAPAGDWECLTAAVENGADAVYFGLQGHNARARASNFGLEELPKVVAFLHRRGVRGYVTLNTLVFPDELDELETMVRGISKAGVDAVIVQDLGLARLIRTVAPELEIHASTQTSVTNVEGLELAKELGFGRLILARELSLDEIAKIQKAAILPVEVFVHGALCVAYSGQCLTSEALGRRSANRGECAQACRLPYTLVSDGKRVDLDDIQYLLSPKDLAAFDLVPKLIELGVASLKIEGRLKTPEYVANITKHYRKAIDDATAGKATLWSNQAIQEMELSFSRGFSHGFLDGNNHKTLVRGDYSKKKGLFLGEIAKISASHVHLNALAPVKPGDGIVFDGDEAAGIPEQGGRVYEVFKVSPGGKIEPAGKDIESGPLILAFGTRDIDTSLLRTGQHLWKTDDPELNRRLRSTFEGSPRRLVSLSVRVRAAVGETLAIEAETSDGRVARSESPDRLVAAARSPADPGSLKAQFDRLGGSIYTLACFEATVEENPFVPASLLNNLRRDLLADLDKAASEPRTRKLKAEPALAALLEPIRNERDRSASANPRLPTLSALCRTLEQVEASAAAGAATIYLEFQHIPLYHEAIQLARKKQGKVYLTTLRIEKPGEEGLLRHLARQGADGLLVRNASGLHFCARHNIPFVADFALNAANPLTVDLFKSKGAQKITASYDMSIRQLEDLLGSVPAEWIEIVIHQHIPMFHMEHCVFCAFLSPGTDKTNCGRPCDRHTVELRDRVGMDHPLKADIGCRNTLYNAVPQTAAEALPRLLELGARDFRVEFLEDTLDDATRTLSLYRDAIAGNRNPGTLWRSLKAINRYGITRGSLEDTPQEPISIQPIGKK